MRDNEDLSNRVSQGKNSKIAWIGLMFCVTSLYFIFNPVKCSAPNFSSGNNFPLPAESPKPAEESPKPTMPCPPAKERKEIRVQVDPVEWSGWIAIPANSWWEVNRPGCWEEYLYIDGTLEKVDDGETKGPGSIPRSTFKIRGTKGEVVIYYEPK